MQTAEYLERLNTLITSASGTPKSADYKKNYEECEQFLHDEYRKLYKEIGELAYQAPFDEKSFAEKYQHCQVLTDKMRELLQTKGAAERADRNFENAKSYLLELQQEINYALLLKNKIQQLMTSDSSFRDRCSTLLDTFQQEIMALFRRAYPNYRQEKPLSKKYSDEEVLIITLKTLPKWLLLAKKYHIGANDYYYLLRMWFESFDTETTEKAEQVVDLAFAMVAHSINPGKALKNIANESLSKPYRWKWLDGREEERPWTVADIEDRLLLLQKIEQHSSRPVEDTVFHKRDRGALALDQEVALVFEKYPDLYWRFKKHGVQMNPYWYLNPDHLFILTGLFEIISPDDVEQLLGPTLYGMIPAAKIPDMIKLLTWMRDAIAHDASAATQAKMSEFAHRLMALMRDNIQLAEQIFTLPQEKYPALCEFMQDKFSFEKLTITDFASVFQDDKQRMAKVTCELFNEITQQNAALILPLHFWLNTILKMHDAHFAKSNALSFSAKLEKLPQHYLQLIYKMLKVTKAQPDCVEHFIALSSALPYSEAMKNYLLKLEAIKDENRATTMAAFNLLVSDNPDLMPHLLEKLEIISLLKKLQETDLPLYLMLAARTTLNKECVEKLLADEVLRSRFAVLFQIEKERGIELASIFLMDKDTLDLLKDPLLKTLVSQPGFSEQISRAYSHKFVGGTEARVKQLAQLNKLLTTDEKTVFDLLAFSGANPRTLRYLLGKSVENETFFTRDVTGKDKAQTLYHLARDFYQTYQVLQPDYVKRIAWLMERDKDDVALLLIKASNNESLKPYLVHFFHLVQGGYYSAVTTLFEKLEKKPDDVFFLKLLTLASGKKGSLVEACLTVDETNEKELHGYIMKSSVDQLASDQFKQIMILRAQGETEKYKQLLQENGKPAPLAEAKQSATININSESLEKILLSFMTPDDIKALDEQGLKAKQWVKFSLGLGHLVVAENGLLNTDSIEKIKALPVWEKLQRTPAFKKYLERVLQTFRQYPAFAERLQKLEAPLPGTLGENIIRALLKLPKDQVVTACHARTAVISTLLMPIIQDSVGSCFATSILIQASTYPDGLLQMLEDYMSLLSRSCLTRMKRTVEKTPVDYPMEFNFDDFANMFAGDNLLSRAYEYTAARMAASYKSIDTIKSYTKLLWVLHFGEEAKVWLDDNPELWLKFREILESVAEESCSVTYDGHTKNNYTKHQGSWLLQDAETKQPLGEDEKVTAHFYEKMLAKWRQKFMAVHPEHTALINEMFAGLNRFAQSARFRKKLFANMGYESYGVARINSIKYQVLLNRTPYRVHEGGYTCETVRNYHVSEVVDESLPCEFNPLRSLENFAANIADEKDADADRWMSCGGQGHAFTINISQLKRLAAKDSQAAAAEMRHAANLLAKTSCSEATYLALIEYYVAQQQYPNQDIRQLHKNLLLKNISGYHCLNDLCQEIIATDSELMGENRRSVGRLIDDAIRLCPALQDKLPPVFFFAESNEETAAQIGLTCRVHDSSFDYVFATDSKKHVPEAWSPRFLWNCTVRHHANGADEISRGYFRKKC